MMLMALSPNIEEVEEVPEMLIKAVANQPLLLSWLYELQQGKDLMSTKSYATACYYIDEVKRLRIPSGELKQALLDGKFMDMP